MDQGRAERLYQKADAGRWNVPVEVFASVLERSAGKALAGREPSAGDLDRYYDSLHLGDLALACACAAGSEDAWDHFIVEFRPALYRAADAIDASGAARDVADALYAELFGLREKDGVRQSVFRYFHGRSSLATWLRALIAQRLVDRHRETRRLDPITEEASASAASGSAVDTDGTRYAATIRTVLAGAIAALAPRDRLRLACYYAQEMTLAQIGKLTREHEATVSRQLARTRRAIRADVETRLHTAHGFSKAEVDECFASIVNDSGNLDLEEWLDTASPPSPGHGGARKKIAVDRSMSEDRS